MGTAQFEAMRAAMDRRFGPWAVKLAVEARRPDLNAREECAEAIADLLRRGDLYLFRAPLGWGEEDVLAPSEALEALLDERVWRPRMLSARRRPRLAATEQGRARFLQGEFGTPEPITRLFRPASEVFELQPISCLEVAGMFFATAGFFLGGFLGAYLTSGFQFSLSSWGLTTILGMVVGGPLGMALAMMAWRKRFPSDAVVKESPFRIPDQYMRGPTLNPTDECGDPRY